MVGDCCGSPRKAVISCAMMLWIGRASASLGHGGGIYIELDRGSPSPHHVGLEVWWDINDEGVAPGIHGGIDLLDGQGCGWQEAGWQGVADAPGQRRAIFVDNGHGGVRTSVEACLAGA